MRYEHYLRFTLGADDAATFRPQEARRQANIRLAGRYPAEVADVTWDPRAQAIVVAVILPDRDHSAEVGWLLREALGLRPAEDGFPVAVRPPSPVLDTVGSGGSYGAGSVPPPPGGAPPAPLPPPPDPPRPVPPQPGGAPPGAPPPQQPGSAPAAPTAPASRPSPGAGKSAPPPPAPPPPSGAPPPGDTDSRRGWRDWLKRRGTGGERGTGDPGPGWVPANGGMEEELARSAPPHPGASAPPATRYLRGEYPGQVRLWKPFSLVVRVTAARGGGSPLKPFSVPRQGQDVLLVAHSPGVRVLGEHRQVLHVPAAGDSEPARFDLRAETPGPGAVSVTAWLGGTYLGEFIAEISAERDGPEGPARQGHGELDAGPGAGDPGEGTVSLVVRRDTGTGGYRFEFRDIDLPDEVTSQVTGEPGRRVEALIGDLTALAQGRAGFTPGQARRYLMNEGAKLWRELIPDPIRDQFWERQGRIRQLTILTKDDIVPWELLYPKDPGRDEGFLVEQFPVTRLVFGQVPARRLRLAPAWFVLPDGSPPEAGQEIGALRSLLGLPDPPADVISGLDPLAGLLDSGDFGLLHFACHNTFDPAAGSSIRFGPARFEPAYMTMAAIDRTLARSGPLVFINACRAAGLAPSYHHLDGWASSFMAAGAGAFIGSQWAVADETAREFALAVYGELGAGVPLGQAVQYARLAISGKPTDPTWLAYSVYGHPQAAVRAAGGTGAGRA
jgi:CHAT domain-containing protein